MSISQKDIKKLFSLSAGMCNICRLQLAEHDIQIGEMAHIIAKSPNGPRGANQSLEINSYNNLILLCPTHHKIVDKNPKEYPIEKLNEIKNTHEKFVSSRLNTDIEYQSDLSSLNTLFHYIPIKDFRGMAMNLPYKISVNFNARDMFEAFCIDNPDKYPFWDNDLTELWNKFLESMDRINDWLSGTLTIKNNRLMTLEEMLNNHQNIEPGYNIFVSNDDGYIVLNKKFLNYDQINLVVKSLERLVQEFIYAHTELINYIRYNYREIQW
jgi:hypothetical protein